MSKINLNTSIADYGFSQINNNFQLIEDELNQKVLYRDNPVGEPNALDNDLDANGKNVFGVNDLHVDNEIFLKGETISQAIDTAAGGLVGDAKSSADAAAASAILSQSSATSSAASAASSAASYDSFDDRYLGAKATPPTVDNDGNTLLIGALYWDTTLSPGGTFPASDITFAPSGSIGSTTVQAAIQELDTEKAPLASPVFTGDPQAPTPATADNDTSIATTAYVVAKQQAPSTIGSVTPNSGVFTTLRGNSLAKVIADASTAQSVPNNTLTTITNWTSRLDTASNFNAATGTFTAPRAGRYMVTASYQLAAATYAAGNEVTVVIAKNGSQHRTSRFVTPALTTITVNSPVVSALVDLALNDTIVIQAFQNSGGAINTASANAANTFVTITELP